MAIQGNLKSLQVCHMCLGLSVSFHQFGMGAPVGRNANELSVLPESFGRLKALEDAAQQRAALARLESDRA